MERVTKDNYYLDIAQTVAERGTCLRRLLNCSCLDAECENDTIVSTGYNGAPRGRKNCCDLKFCYREKLNIPRGERYELCRSVHAEANAIIAASREQTLGSTLYLACIDPETHEALGGTSCCSMCRRMVINAGIERVVVRDTKDEYRVIPVSEWIENDDSLSGDFGY